MFLFLNKSEKQKGLRAQAGQIMIISIVFFICISTFIILALANPLVRHISMASAASISKESFYAAEAGMEDAVYRLKSGLPLASSDTLAVGGNTVVTSVADEAGGKSVVATGDANDYSRKVQTHLVLGTGVAFHYGIQAGAGGFVLQNSSSVTGNVYSDGLVTGAGNDIFGDVVSAGSSGSISGIHAHGSAYSHNIDDSVIDNDAYYTNISDSSVFGTPHPGSPDQPIADLPISDEQIAEWESFAEAGGVIPATACEGGTYNVTSDTTLGPVKIECDLAVKGNGVTLTMTGPIWVTGNISTQNAPVIRILPSLGNQNVALIADNQANRAGSGIVTIGQNTQFYGSGFPNSFVFIISQNNSAETGGTAEAFFMGQSSGALVAYASHGQITLGQSVNVKEATAYKIVLKNTANVVYDTGLPSTLFSNGPAGGFDISSWREVE